MCCVNFNRLLWIRGVTFPTPYNEGSKIWSKSSEVKSFWACIYVQSRIPAFSTRPGDGAVTHPCPRLPLADSTCLMRLICFLCSSPRAAFCADSSLSRRRFSSDTYGSISTWWLMPACASPSSLLYKQRRVEMKSTLKSAESGCYPIRFSLNMPGYKS